MNPQQDKQGHTPSEETGKWLLEGNTIYILEKTGQMTGKGATYRPEVCNRVSATFQSLHRGVASKAAQEVFRACNSHNPLVDALKSALSSNEVGVFRLHPQVFEKITSALKLAQEEA